MPIKLWTKYGGLSFSARAGGCVEWGKRWLPLNRWVNLDAKKQQLLNDLFRLNRRMMKAYLLKESLDRLWTYRYEGAAERYLNQWIDQLRWQGSNPSRS